MVDNNKRTAAEQSYAAVTAWWKPAVVTRKPFFATGTKGGQGGLCAMSAHVDGCYLSVITRTIGLRSFDYASLRHLLTFSNDVSVYIWKILPHGASVLFPQRKQPYKQPARSYATNIFLPVEEEGGGRWSISRTIDGRAYLRPLFLGGHCVRGRLIRKM